MSDDEIFVGLDDSPSNEGPRREELVAELVALAESGEIKYTTKYIKKTGREALEKIKRNHYRKQLDEANEFISDSLISKFSELMGNMGAVHDTDVMETELTNNQLLKRDLKSIIGRLAPYIPLVGLLCGGIIVGKHVFVGTGADETDQPKDE